MTDGVSSKENVGPVRQTQMQASSASFGQSVRYGLSILWVLAKYLTHRSGLRRQRQFQSLERRYSGA